MTKKDDDWQLPDPEQQSRAGKTKEERAGPRGGQGENSIGVGERTKTRFGAIKSTRESQPTLTFE